MSNFNTELFQALSQGLSIDEIIRSEIESTINHLLKTELTAFLDYEPYDPIGTEHFLVYDINQEKIIQIANTEKHIGEFCANSVLFWKDYFVIY